VDLLGLGMMAVLKDSLGLIREHYGEEVDLAHLPQNCPDVYGTIRKADTIGMFQIESRAQMASLPLNNPQVFNDLTAQVAIIRPGPIQGGMTNPYLRRRQGKEPVTYAHPLLIPILKPTLGVPLYQEQLLRMAKECARITAGQAEELRRSMGHKRSVERMQEMDSVLIEGMIQNGIPAEARNTILNQIKSFALYGFPQSHAASFALLAYASAFLKVRYLAAFTAALLNNQPMGFYHPATLVKDAQRHGLRVKAIDVTCSDWNCSLENDRSQLFLRVGLCYVRGLQQAAAEALTQQRSLAPFASVEDLARRVPQLSRANLEMLARIGALNNLGDDRRLHRRDALWQVGLATHKVGPLFEGIYETEGASPLAPMSIEERLVSDYHGTGMTVGPHPMAYRREALRTMGVVSSDQLKRLRDGSSATVAGHVIVRQRPGTAKGVIFLTLEDETGNSNVIAFHDFYEQNRITVVRERFVRISGVVQNRDGVVHLMARSIHPLAVSAAEISSHDFH
jgi:error-prone DNA polymerase